MADELLPLGKGFASANELFFFGNLQRSYRLTVTIFQRGGIEIHINVLCCFCLNNMLVNLFALVISC